MLRKALLFVLMSVFAVSAPASAGTVDISRQIEKRDAVKIYISGISNGSGQNQISADAFKKVLESSIINRRSVKFQIVSDPASSDFQVSAVIKKYAYSKTDPVNTYGAGSAGLILDAVTTENYAEMGVDFTVTSTRSGKNVWNENVFDYVEHTMTPEQSIPLVYDKVARRFLWKAFGKGK
jgi:hypothetical protein